MKKYLPKTKTSQGFTLVELMVVVTVIAILAAIGLTVFSGTQKNARDAKRKADIEAISKALESRVNGLKDQNCTGNAGTYCAPVSGWFANSVIPTDPQSGASYTTMPTDGASSYTICATLEAGGTYCLSKQQ